MIGQYTRYVLWGVLFCVLFFLNKTYTDTLIYAQTSVRLNVEPDLQEILIDGGDMEILFEAQTSDPGAQFEWNLEGPGELLGEHTSPAILYVAPKSIEKASTYATISVLVTDVTGKSKFKTITFSLIVPAPTPIPSPSRSPTAPTPSLIEQHLHNARIYLDNNRYTIPAERNAFEEYKAILAIDPMNREARKGLYEILEKYNSLIEDQCRKRLYNGARRRFERHQMVAGYMLDTFDFREDLNIRQKIQEVEELLRDCIPPTPAPTTAPSPTLTATPTQRSIQIKGIHLTDEGGNTIEPVNKVYAVKLGETITITVDVINPDNHEISFIWQGKLLKVADTFRQKTFYTATKLGSEVITVYVRDKETDEQLYKSIAVTVTAE